MVLQAVGYYRLTCYLYLFRGPEAEFDDGRVWIRVFSDHRAGTTLRHAGDLIDFDRRMYSLVMDGVERIDVRWLRRVNESKTRSDEQCVEYVREKDVDRMPVWVVIQILELVHPFIFHHSIRRQEAEGIALELGIPPKKILTLGWPA